MITYEQARPLVFAVLREHPQGQHANVVENVLHRVHQSSPVQRLERRPASVNAGEEQQVEEIVRQLMWRMLIDGVIVFGLDAVNNAWPFYSVTEYGKKVVAGETAQPYDPEGFVAYFVQQCPGADDVIREYFIEAVTCFNSGCHRASVIMLGASSERLIQNLKEATASSMPEAQREKFRRDCGSKISKVFQTTKGRLDYSVSQGLLSAPHDETVSSTLPAVFDVLRRSRNDAGHPTTPAPIDRDTAFINLRVFVEYARRVLLLDASIRAV